MPESNVMLYIIGEMAILLLVICAFLFFHISNLRKLIKKLEAKIVECRATIRKYRNEAKAALSKLAEQSNIIPKKFVDYLDDEIDTTRDYHKSLNPDRDIVLDITQGAPIERQVASLRHAFLLAEKEARFAGDDNHSSWDVLQGKFSQIISFYETDSAPAEADEAEAADEDEVAQLKKRIENLEKFKKLFFEMEAKWESSNKDADQYKEELMALGIQLGGGEHFKDLLENYSKSYDALGLLIEENSDSEAADKPDKVDFNGEKSHIRKTVIANQDEIERLKNMAVDQHRVIVDLKKQLMAASSEEAKQQVIDELEQQLDKQDRFLKEAETCMQLLEDELSRAIQENEELRNQLEGQEDASGGDDDEKLHELETLIGDLTKESHDMLGTIAALEEENKALKQQIQQAEQGGDVATEDSKALQEKLTEVQQELLNLQTQHIELEERYLELKTKS